MVARDGSFWKEDMVSFQHLMSERGLKLWKAGRDCAIQ